MEWLGGPVDLDRLQTLTRAYAARHHVPIAAVDQLINLLQSDVAQELLALPAEDWEDVLVRQRRCANRHFFTMHFFTKQPLCSLVMMQVNDLYKVKTTQTTEKQHRPKHTLPIDIRPHARTLTHTYSHTHCTHPSVGIQIQ